MSDVVILTTIAGRPCAFHASEVETVIEIDGITAIPRAPPHVIGLTALRSQALTVMDSRVIVGDDPKEFSTDSRAAVIRVDSHSYALLVDQISDVSTMLCEPNSLPGGFGKRWSNFAEGLIETDRGPVLLLSAPRLIASSEQSCNVA